MSVIKIWLLAIRPKTLAASVAPVILGGAIAFHFGHFNKWILLMTLLGAVCLQIGSNLANDYFDFKKGSDTLERKGPLRVMQSSLWAPSQMKWAMTLVFSLSLVIGAWLIKIGGPIILLIGLISITCALLYTAGPYPLAYLGLGDIFVFLFFGPMAVCGTYFLQTGVWSFLVLLMSFPMGFISIAILTVNNVRDFTEDRKTRKKTIVVRLGERYGKIQYTVCLAISILCPIIYFVCGLTPKGVLICLPLVFLCIPMIKAIWSLESATRLNSLLGETGRYLLLYGLTQSVGWLV